MNFQTIIHQPEKKIRLSKTSSVSSTVNLLSAYFFLLNFQTNHQHTACLILGRKILVVLFCVMTNYDFPKKLHLYLNNFAFSPNVNGLNCFSWKKMKNMTRFKSSLWKKKWDKRFLCQKKAKGSQAIVVNVSKELETKMAQQYFSTFPPRT